MGFHIFESQDKRDSSYYSGIKERKELKQYINLSENAWVVIDEDIQDLNIKNPENVTFSGFLNRIFYNFHQQSNASISIRVQEYKEKLIDIVSQKSNGAKGSEKKERTAIERFATNAAEAYAQELISKSRSYTSKGEGRKFNVNKQNIEILLSSDESFYYEDHIGSYMKALFEEYTQKKAFERESIFYKDTVDKINIALAQSTKLKITIKQNQFGNIVDRKFYITPYKILQDKAGMYNYLVGFSEEILEDGILAQKTITSIRISKIYKIAVMNSMRAFISNESKAILEKELRQKTAQYLISELIDVKVQFKKSGLERFFKKVYMRPACYEKIGDLTYVFHCTRRQAEIYFFSFGSDLTILEPIELQKLFARWYKNAANQYLSIIELKESTENEQYHLIN